MQKMHHLFAAQSHSFVGERAYLWRGERWPLRLTFIDFSVVFSLFMVACMTMLRNTEVTREERFLLTFCFIYLLSLMATIVTERYRMVAFVCMIPLAAHGLVCLFSNSLVRWRLLSVASVVFLMSQLLAHTAPAEYKTDFDKHLAIEKRADNNNFKRFLGARLAVESNLDRRSCANFQRQLKSNNFDFDLQANARRCRGLKK